MAKARVLFGIAIGFVIGASVSGLLSWLPTLSEAKSKKMEQELAQAAQTAIKKAEPDTAAKAKSKIDAMGTEEKATGMEMDSAKAQKIASKWDGAQANLASGGAIHDLGPNVAPFLKEVPLKRKTTSQYRSIWEEHQWMENLCKAGSPPSPLCHHVVVLPQQKVSFCAGAKVASTTIKYYFFKIADGSVVIPGGVNSVHYGNFTRFAQLDPPTRKELLMSAEWTHVFFWRPVLDRFVSGYLDKVVKSCNRLDFKNNSRLAIKHYDQYGFSCDKHQDLESFVSFMEGVTATRMEGHFAPQTTLCDVEKFPYTDFIVANQTLSANLKVLSKKLGVEHPEGSQHTSSHKTGATNKMVSLFEGKQELIGRILKLLEEDCKQIPEACDVKNAKDELP